MSKDKVTADASKREFVKKATYVVPAVLTLTATPRFAGAGSGAGKTKYNNGGYQDKSNYKTYETSDTENEKRDKSKKRDRDN